jgi:hypothetical protein
MIEWLLAQDASISIALASAVVALCALGVTFWQGYLMRQHNKISVRPKLTATENYEDTDKARAISFELINSGFGPAIIKDFILVYDGEEVSRNNRKTYDDFLRKKTRAFTDVNIFFFVPDSSLLMNERCELFSFRYKHGQDASFIHKLNLRVSYQSIYEDETFMYDSRKDRQFGGLEAAA